MRMNGHSKKNLDIVWKQEKIIIGIEDNCVIGLTCLIYIDYILKRMIVTLCTYLIIINLK